MVLWSLTGMAPATQQIDPPLRLLFLELPRHGQHPLPQKDNGGELERDEGCAGAWLAARGVSLDWGLAPVNTPE